MANEYKTTRLEENLTTVRKALGELQHSLNHLYGKQAPLILIYGSYARGQVQPDSDIDVLLLYPYDVHPAEEIQRVSAILADMNLRYQVLISVLPAHINEYQNSQEIFWKNVRRESISRDRL
jgi:uncharacterized protein